MKQKTGRKMLNFLLTLAMLVGLVPGMGMTAYAEGTAVDLSTLTGNYTATDGDVLSGTASGKTVTIPAGATVTLNGVNISNGSITCSGNATIILMGDNTVTATATSEKAAIKIGGSGTTLTISGSGSLTAQGGSGSGIGGGAGIGMDYTNDGTLSGGNIVINGGTVIATGGRCGAGIGTGLAQGMPGLASITCGDITINGGTVIATGGQFAAGIGTGVSTGKNASNECGAITIGTGVISVTATKGAGSPNSIGIGDADTGTQTCGTITIDGVVNATTSSTFEHFNSAVSGNTWTLTIKATVTANNRTYDGTEKPLVTVTGTPTGGTMNYAIGSDATTAPTEGWGTSIPAKTNAGTYYVWYKVVGDENHSDTAPACVEVIIKSRPVYQPSAPSSALTVTSEIGTITRVTVDGKTVNSKYYFISGSNVVLSEEFMSTLAPGKHTIRLYDGKTYATATWTIEGTASAQQAKTAATGDAGVTHYGVLAAAAAAAICAVLACAWVARKRKAA